MNNSTKTLPEGYAQSGEINLKKNKRLAIILNIAAVFVFFPSFFLLSRFAALIRPGIMNLAGTIRLGMVAALIGLYAISVIIHELIHGIFFRVFTRSKPVFALRLPFYVSVSAPDWYIPSRKYIIVALSPLVIIGAIGLLLILLAPERWVMFVVFVVAMNTGGSIGDLFVLTRLLKLSPACLANDTGDGVAFYKHPSTINHP